MDCTSPTFNNFPTKHLSSQKDISALTLKFGELSSTVFWILLVFPSLTAWAKERYWTLWFQTFRVWTCRRNVWFGFSCLLYLGLFACGFHLSIHMESSCLSKTNTFHTPRNLTKSKRCFVTFSFQEMNTSTTFPQRRKTRHKSFAWNSLGKLIKKNVMFAIYNKTLRMKSLSLTLS